MAMKRRAYSSRLSGSPRRFPTPQAPEPLPPLPETTLEVLNSLCQWAALHAIIGGPAAWNHAADDVWDTRNDLREIEEATPDAARTPAP